MTPLDIMSQDSISKVPKTVDTLLENSSATVEKVHIAKDGTEIPVEVSTHNFKLNGKNVALAIIRDITERKKTEKKSKNVHDL